MNVRAQATGMASQTQNIGNSKMTMQSGLWGGYPGATSYRHNVRDTNFFELAGGLPRLRPFGVTVEGPVPANAAIARSIPSISFFNSAMISWISKVTPHTCKYPGNLAVSPIKRNTPYIRD